MATPEKEAILFALSNTPKGRLKKKWADTSDFLEYTDETWSEIPLSGNNCLSDGEVPRLLSEHQRLSGPLYCINQIQQTGDNLENEAKKYFLDEDNRPKCAFPVATTEDTKSALQRPACPPPSSQLPQRQQIPTVWKSPEDEMLKKMKEKYNNLLEDAIKEKQRILMEGFDSILTEFERKYQDLKISQRLRSERRAKWLDDELADGLKSYEQNLKALKEESSKKRQQSLVNIEDMINQSMQEATTTRKQQLEEMEEKKQFEAHCHELMNSLLSNYNQNEETLNSSIFKSDAEAYAQKGLIVNNQLRAKAIEAMNDMNPKSLSILRSCVSNMETVTSTINQNAEKLKKTRQQKYQQQSVVQQPDVQQPVVQQPDVRQPDLRQPDLRQPVVQQPDVRQPDLRAQNQEHSQQEQPNQKIPSTAPVTSAQPIRETVVASSTESVQKQDPIHEESLKEYLELNDLLKEANKRTEYLSSTPELKTLQMELYKAINVTINSISMQSGSHIKGKLDRLISLITGSPIQVGEKRISTRNIPEATVFCQNLIAKKLVDQAEAQVSVNFKASFPIASVIVGLMNHSITMANLIKGYFYTQCPFLVPYYPKRLTGQDDASYYSSLGFKMNKAGTREKPDLYLKRMIGLTRLFSSILISDAAGGSKNSCLNVAHAWKLIAQILSLPPQPIITAVVLNHIITVCGHKLFSVFGRQAKKLFDYVARVYLPRIKNVTDEETDGGALGKLQLSIEDIIDQNSMAPPEGFIQPHFWYTS